MADSDSEAETLIQSPEKQKVNVVEKTPKLRLITRTADDDHRAERAPGSPILALKAESPAGTSRKRKRSHSRSAEPELASSGLHRTSSGSPAPSLESGGEVSGLLQQNSSRYSQSKGASRNRTTKDNEAKNSSFLGSTANQQQRSQSEVEDEQARALRQRHTLESMASNRRGVRSATYPRQRSPERAVSPRRADTQGRTPSTQSLQTLASQKSRRVPTPLSILRNDSSDRSSERSNSPAPSRPTHFKPTPTEFEALSPAKSMVKKLRDRHGRTLLAQACTDDKLDRVKQMYEERPQDLNLADNAGNTPLQIAALQGYVEIVEFLLEKNCDVNTRNIEKDTPLIDAVENGHAEVVKLLLNHDADPRIGNATGQKPLELVDEDDEAIRRLLIRAKNKSLNRRQSEDQAPPQAARESSALTNAVLSPRESPSLHGPKSPPMAPLSRRRAREQTRNDLLWQANTPENLTKLAGKGDTEGVVNILNILNKASPDALIAACKGGHDEVLQLLIAMGNPDPDPDPVLSHDHRREYNTPMLAAIGEGNLQNVRLLLAQDGFNPMREIRGRPYYVISEERKGEHWTEERDILKTAYDEYRHRHRQAASPRKVREGERRRAQGSSSPISRRIAGSLDHVTNRSSRSIDHLGKDRHVHQTDETTSSNNFTTGHHRRSSHRKVHNLNRNESDAQEVQIEGDSLKRRRLIQGKERADRSEHPVRTTLAMGSTGRGKPIQEQQLEHREVSRRRTSDATKPTPPLDPLSVKKRPRRALSDSSPEENRSMKRKISNHADQVDFSAKIKLQPIEEYDFHPVKREPCEEISSVIAPLADGLGMTVRPASKPTDQQVVAEKDGLQQQKTVEKPPGSLRAEDESAGKEELPLANFKHEKEQPIVDKSGGEKGHRPVPEDEVQHGAEQEEFFSLGQGQVDEQTQARETEASQVAEAETLPEEDRNQAEEDEFPTATATKVEEEAALAQKNAAEEALAQEKVEKLQRQEQLQREADEIKRLEQIRLEADEAERQERLRREKAEQEQQQEQMEREAAEAARQEQLKREAADAERQEQLRREAEEAARQEQLKREKAEAERLEQLRRDAEEAARKEQLKREEERQRQLMHEREQKRIESLPLLLRQAAQLLDADKLSAKHPEFLRRFLPLPTVWTEQLDPECSGEVAYNEWTPGFQVAPLLGSKDLGLEYMTGWEKRTVTEQERMALFSVSQAMLVQKTIGVGTYIHLSMARVVELQQEASTQFQVMQPMVWIKVRAGFSFLFAPRISYAFWLVAATFYPPSKLLLFVVFSDFASPHHHHYHHHALANTESSYRTFSTAFLTIHTSTASPSKRKGLFYSNPAENPKSSVPMSSNRQTSIVMSTILQASPPLALLIAFLGLNLYLSPNLS